MCLQQLDSWGRLSGTIGKEVCFSYDRLNTDYRLIYRINFAYNLDPNTKTKPGRKHQLFVCKFLLTDCRIHSGPYWSHYGAAADTLQLTSANIILFKDSNRTDATDFIIRSPSLYK